MDIIDQSGVLDSTDETATEKVEQLIDKAEWENAWYELSGTFTNDFPSFTKLTCERLPRINFSNVTKLNYTFSGMSNLKRIEYYLNTDSCTSFGSTFQGSKLLEYVKGVNTSKGESFGWFFANCSSLKIIEEPLDFSSLTGSTNPFGGCSSLEELRIVSESISYSFVVANTAKLSAESVQSIIDGLAPIETAQTLTLHADVKAKLTEEQLATITSKNWNLA